MLRGLDDLVRAGKVLYTGISDTPAWVVAKANAIAEERHWTRFNAVQVEYNLVERTSEREILPMARDEKLTVLAWSPLAGGLLSGKYRTNHKKQQDGSRLDDSPRLNDRNLAIADAVAAVADERSVSPSSVALAWIRQNPGIIPVVGVRKPQQLRENLTSLNLVLTPEQLDSLEEVSRITLGFPHDFMRSENVQKTVYGSYHYVTNR